MIQYFFRIKFIIDDFVTKSEENNNCADKEDCTELGIVDLNSCEFAPWANERCPLTCGACTNKSKFLLQFCKILLILIV